MSFPYFPSDPDNFADAFEPVPVLNTQEDVSSCTVLIKIYASDLLIVGGRVQLYLPAPPSLGTINNMTISEAAASGNAFDSLATPTAILKDAAAAYTYTGEPIDTDETTFLINKDRALLIGFNMAASSYALLGHAPGITTYIAPAVQEADDAVRAGVYVPHPDTIYILGMLRAAP